jgi:hypothetical protein
MKMRPSSLYPLQERKKCYYKNNNDSRFGKDGQPTDRIKAYTWHDAIEYVKYNYFEKKSKENLNINCEKDFAYLEI